MSVRTDRAAGSAPAPVLTPTGISVTTWDDRRPDDDREPGDERRPDDEHGPGHRRTPALLLHCDASTGVGDFRAQRPLAERRPLHLPDRPGYGASPRVRVDFEAETDHYLPLLEGGVHVVGHSNGGVAAMILAARAPEAVRSLTLVEPPAFGITEHPDAVTTRRQLVDLWESGTEDEFAFWTAFSTLIGEKPWPRRPLPDTLLPGVRAAMGSRGPWEARPDWATLRAATFPVLVISGGHHAGFEAVADAIAEHTGGERLVLPGRRHMVPAVGAAFNDAVEGHWSRAERD
ncbi:Hydrolase, alpha/beta fold family [Actinomycetales bacterium JB111]|nr:Hydrolase, alpha/beta fold family [Actinomycetales bacterium JB111]